MPEQDTPRRATRDLKYTSIDNFLERIGRNGSSDRVARGR